MSLITSCPACGTMFRVVPDQLKISEGWVRCGHCTEVFDATANLTEEVTLGEAPPAAAEPPGSDEMIRGWEATATAGLTSPGALPGGTLPGIGEGYTPAFVNSVPGVRSVPPAPEPASPPPRALRDLPPDSQSPRPTRDLPPDSQSPEPTDLDAPFVFRRSDLLTDGAPSVYPPAGPQAGDSHLPAEDDEHEAAARQDVSFVRQARRKAFWRRPLVRAFLVLLALALGALLALQYAWQERDRLALLQPRLKPALELMCEHLGCTLGAPRQIEAVVIESSGFNRLRNDTYKLSFSLRNNARTSVAVPSLELTLTDAQDQPLLRRVLAPADLGAVDGSIAAGADWGGSVGIVVNPGGSTRVAGYRLLAFYP